MKDPSKLNDFVTQYGGPGSALDENLMIEYQDGDVKVYWASVYGNGFVKTPKGFFTSQAVYRNFCVDVARRLPGKRGGVEFDSYVRERLEQAALRETPPGMEEGAVVRHAIFSTLWQYRQSNMWGGGKKENAERYCDYDNPERVKRSMAKGDPAFIETRPEGPGYPELFVRINALMDFMTYLQSQGSFERKILREEVVYELKKISRPPYPATGVSPRRLRSTYSIPYSMYEEWREEDTRIDEREELGYQNR
jgi:hypothetical protein